MPQKTKFRVCSGCFKICKNSDFQCCYDWTSPEFFTSYWNKYALEKLEGPEKEVFVSTTLKNRTWQRKRARRLLNIAKRGGWGGWTD